MDITKEVVSTNELVLVGKFIHGGGGFRMPEGEEKHFIFSLPSNDMSVICLFEEYCPEQSMAALLAIARCHHNGGDDYDELISRGCNYDKLPRMLVAELKPTSGIKGDTESGVLYITTDLTTYGTTDTQLGLSLREANQITIRAEINGWASGTVAIREMFSGLNETVKASCLSDLVPIVVDYLNKTYPKFMNVVDIRRKVIAKFLKTFEPRDGVRIKTISPFGRVSLVREEVLGPKNADKVIKVVDEYFVSAHSDTEVSVEWPVADAEFIASTAANGAVNGILEKWL